MSINATTTTGPSGSDGVPGRFDALAELHGVLGREYDASLRVLQEALANLRDSQEQLKKQSEEQPKQQRDQMETSVKKLKASYRGQTKERLEMLREQVGGAARRGGVDSRILVGNAGTTEGRTNQGGRATPTRVGAMSAQEVGAGPARHMEGAGAGEGGGARVGGEGDGAGTGVGDEGATGAVAAAGKAVTGGCGEVRQQGGRRR